MPVVFEGNAGKVIAISDKASAGTVSIAKVEGTGAFSFNNLRSIITKIGLGASGNFQFAHSVGNDVYVYVFGDRMGSIRIHGLSFEQQCPRNQGHGVEALIRWYEANRIAARQEPIRVTIGSRTAFDGFLTSLQVDSSDPQSRMVSYVMTVATIPNKV